jgi:hypothetical protein
MNKLFIRGVTFLAIGIIIAQAVNFMLISGLRVQKTGDYGVFNKIVDGRINAEILITGSSRALVHFASDTISAAMGNKSCFNIGLDGSPLNLQLPYLKTYLKYNNPPSILIQELDITSFQNRSEIHNPMIYLPYLNENYLYENLVALDPSFWRFKYIPLYGFATAQFYYKDLAISSIWGCQQVEFRFDGFMPVDKSWTDDFDKFRSANPHGDSYRIDSTAIGDLEAIIRIGQRLGAKVILVYSPEYYENYPLTQNRADIFDIIKKISSEHNLPFWDFTGIPLSYDKQYFYNSQHLNRKGAIIFSKLLAQRLRDYIGDSTKKVANACRKLCTDSILENL